MQGESTTPAQRRWVQRLIEEERVAALWLLLVAAGGLTFATVAGPQAVHHVLDLGPSAMPLHRFVGEGLLAVFFFIAGLELRHEFTVGSLRSPRAAAVPALAATAGMLVPALLFVLLAPASSRAAWGVPMATDLPLALALIAVFGRHLPTSFRAFLLALAIVDDALSIAVVAIVFGGRLDAGWAVATLVGCAVYAGAIRRSTALATVAALCTWVAMLHTGVHPTVLGVVLGLLTSRSGDAMRDRLQPFSAYVAVPLFVGTSLMVPLQGEGFDLRLIGALTAARIIGKPLGIWLVATLLVRVLRPDGALPPRLYAVAGSVAGVGFSVSVLFAELSLDGDALVQTKVAVVAALALAALAAIGTLRVTRQ